MLFRRFFYLISFVSCLCAQTFSFDLSTIPTKSTPQSLVVGDFNGDGKPDLAVSGYNANNQGTVEILLGNGDDTFHSASLTLVGTTTSRIAAADFNRDGKLDVAVSVGFNGQVYILLGNGDGTLQAAIDSGAKTPTGQISSVIPGLAVGDVNGDGNPDLVLGPYTFASSSSIAVMEGNGDGAFQPPVNTSLDALGSPQLKVADFNGDGRSDVFVTGWSNSLQVQRFGELLGNTDGTLSLNWSNITYQFDFGTVMTVHDLNGDGKPDVMAVEYIDYPDDGRLPLLGFMDGSLAGGGGGSVGVPTDSGAGSGYISIAAADVNGDGYADLLISNASGSLLVVLGNGTGTFNGPPGYPPLSPSQTVYTGADSTYNDHWQSIATADFRGVGKQDVVMVLAGKSISLLKNGGTTPVAAPANVVNSASMSAVPSVPGSLASIFGSGLAFGSGVAQNTASTSSAEAPLTLFGLTIQLNGEDVPILYASPTQANVQIPWELAGLTQANLLVTRNGATRAFTLPLAADAPGLFTTNGAGTGQAAALVVAASPIIAAPTGAFPGSRPIHRGEYLSLYGTGLGPVKSGEQTGVPAGCCYNTNETPVVTVGGAPATVQYSGLAPALLGVYQINVLIPDAAPTGVAIPVSVTIGGATSNTVTIAVQ
jgi:uncharacterized protein (TIGR03437 family)